MLTKRHSCTNLIWIDLVVLLFFSSDTGIFFEGGEENLFILPQIRELVKVPQCGREIAEKDLVVESICRADES